MKLLSELRDYPKHEHLVTCYFPARATKLPAYLLAASSSAHHWAT